MEEIPYLSGKQYRLSNDIITSFPSHYMPIYINNMASLIYVETNIPIDTVYGFILHRLAKPYSYAGFNFDFVKSAKFITTDQIGVDFIAKILKCSIETINPAELPIQSIMNLCPNKLFIPFEGAIYSIPTVQIPTIKPVQPVSFGLANGVNIEKYTDALVRLTDSSFCGMCPFILIEMAAMSCGLSNRTEITDEDLDIAVSISNWVIDKYSKYVRGLVGMYNAGIQSQGEKMFIEAIEALGIKSPTAIRVMADKYMIDINRATALINNNINV